VTQNKVSHYGIINSLNRTKACQRDSIFFVKLSVNQELQNYQSFYVFYEWPNL